MCWPSWFTGKFVKLTFTSINNDSNELGIDDGGGGDDDDEDDDDFDYYYDYDCDYDYENYDCGDDDANS